MTLGKGKKQEQEPSRGAPMRGWQNITYDLPVTSTYWPGRKCAAYRGVPEHATNKPALPIMHKNLISDLSLQNSMSFHTWLDDGTVGDFKGSDFLLWRHSCVPEYLHLIFRPLSGIVTERKRKIRSKEIRC